MKILFFKETFVDKIIKNVAWGLVAVMAAWCFGVLALNNGETISASWLVVASVCFYYDRLSLL